MLIPPHFEWATWGCNGKFCLSLTVKLPRHAPGPRGPQSQCTQRGTSSAPRGCVPNNHHCGWASREQGQEDRAVIQETSRRKMLPRWFCGFLRILYPGQHSVAPTLSSVYASFNIAWPTKKIFWLMMQYSVVKALKNVWSLLMWFIYPWNLIVT